MRTSLRCARLCAAATLLALSTALSGQTSEAGFVLSVRGDWFASSRPLERLVTGQVLRDGEQVWAGGSRDFSQSLSIILNRNGERVHFQCSMPTACDRRHTIHAPRSERIRLRELLVAVGALVRDGPTRYVPLITRGGIPLREAVLASTPGGV